MLAVPEIKGQLALIDTGAQHSCIDSAVAKELRLPVLDRIRVSGVHGSLEVNVHLAQVHIPELGYTLYGGFSGVHLMEGGQVHVALLGRSFLRAFTLAYEGPTGSVTLST
jgi:hypothetical protein